MKLLEINHCNKKFGDNEVLKDISLSVEEGQVVNIKLDNYPYMEFGILRGVIHCCAAQHCWKPWTAVT